MGVAVLIIPATTSTTTTAYSAPYSFLIPAAGIIGGLCLAGMGAGIYTGRVETTSGTASKRATALIAIIAVVAFIIGVLLAVM
jgi:hypothetical protein